MPTPSGSDRSRLPVAGFGLLPAVLLAVALLAVGCDGKSPLAFLKPKPAAQKAATADKPAPARAPETIPAARPGTLKPSSEPKPGFGAKTVSSGMKKADPKPPTEPKKAESTKAGPRKAAPRKAEPLSPERPAAAPLSPSDRLGPGYWIQLAAHFKAEGSEAAWKTLSARHRDLLGGEPHAVKRIDLGERGRFYRLLVGPYAARKPAQEKCARLRRAKLACFLVTRRGRDRSAPVAGPPRIVAPKPPATAIPAAAVKPRNQAAPRKTAVTATPAPVKPAPRPRGKPAARKNRAADLPFQRRDSISGATK